jgi:hypothetical protein
VPPRGVDLDLTAWAMLRPTLGDPHAFCACFSSDQRERIVVFALRPSVKRSEMLNAVALHQRLDRGLLVVV